MGDRFLTRRRGVAEKSGWRGEQDVFLGVSAAPRRGLDDWGSKSLGADAEQERERRVVGYSGGDD